MTVFVDPNILKCVGPLQTATSTPMEILLVSAEPVVDTVENFV